jgi:tetratricopeptide (TPR) repeat protein
LALRLSHPHTSAFAESFFSILSQSRREALAVRESSERGIALSAEHGFTAQMALAALQLGWATAEPGHHEQAINQIEASLAAYRATRGELGRPYWLLLLAEAYEKADRLEDGLGALAEALACATEHEDVVCSAEILRWKGELLIRKNGSNHAETQSCFRRAISVARQQGAKSYELRATMSLARLLDRQGQRDQARTMLAEIYGWFTEGLDTADLKDAKALLDQFTG